MNKIKSEQKISLLNEKRLNNISFPVSNIERKKLTENKKKIYTANVITYPHITNISRINSPLTVQLHCDPLKKNYNQDKIKSRPITHKELKVKIRKDKLIQLFPNLQYKINRVYKLNEIQGVRMNKAIETLTNFTKKLELKLSNSSKDLIKKEIDTLKSCNISQNFKKINFKASKPKKQKAKDPNEPLRFSITGECKKTISFDKNIYEIKTRKTKYNNLIRINKKDFHVSFSNFKLPLNKPMFFKNVLNCCEFIETDNNKMTKTIRGLQTCQNFSSIKSLFN